MKLKKILSEINKWWNDFYVELVNVDTLVKYKSQKDDRYNWDLETDIVNQGITEPLVITYFVDDEKITLTDGHHRLDIAIENNINKVPVIVVNDFGNGIRYYSISAKTPPKVPNRPKTDYLKPSDIGIK
jgi:hypothetical protein